MTIKRCPCGCPVPVKHKRLYATTGCMNRVRAKEAIGDKAMPACLTCPRHLSSADVMQGNKRCQACRKLFPGRPQQRRSNVGMPFTAHVPKADKPKAPVTTESWWTAPNLSREEFMARCRSMAPLLQWDTRR